MNLIDRLQKKKNAILVAIIMLVILVGLDQWTKWAVVRSIPLNGVHVVIPGFFELTYLQNFGAAFSSMSGAGMWYFIILTTIALIALSIWFLKNDDSRIDIALSIIIAGAIGNLIDRVMLGYVRDFFQFYIFGYPFAVFNIADVCITLGCVLLFVVMFADDFKAWRMARKEKQ